MSENLAAEYADGIASDIIKRTEAGAPFGWRNRRTEEWEGNEPADWRTAAETEWDEADALDYLAGMLDIEYRVTSEADYRSAEVLIAFGGPNAWIDTKRAALIVTWWSAPETRQLPATFIDGLDAALEELWGDRA